MGQKEEIANLATYLVSDYSNWMSGEVSQQVRFIVSSPDQKAIEALGKINNFSRLGSHMHFSFKQFALAWYIYLV